MWPSSRPDAQIMDYFLAYDGKNSRKRRQRSLSFMRKSKRHVQEHHVEHQRADIVARHKRANSQYNQLRPLSNLFTSVPHFIPPRMRRQSNLVVDPFSSSYQQDDSDYENSAQEFGLDDAEGTPNNYRSSDELTNSAILNNPLEINRHPNHRRRSATFTVTPTNPPLQQLEQSQTSTSTSVISDRLSVFPDELATKPISGHIQEPESNARRADTQAKSIPPNQRMDGERKNELDSSGLERDNSSLSFGTVSIIFLLVCYLIYKIFKSRQRRKKLLGCVESPITLLNLSKQGSKNNGDDMNIEMKRGSSLSNRPGSKKISNKHSREVEGYAREPDSAAIDEIQMAEPLAEEESHPKEGIWPRDSVVMMKRRFAKSSVVMTACRVTRPKVDLISEKVRRVFIDHEADGVRAKARDRGNFALNQEFQRVLRVNWFESIFSSLKQAVYGGNTSRGDPSTLCREDANPESGVTKTLDCSRPDVRVEQEVSEDQTIPQVQTDQVEPAINEIVIRSACNLPSTESRTEPMSELMQTRLMFQTQPDSAAAGLSSPLLRVDSCGCLQSLPPEVRCQSQIDQPALSSHQLCGHLNYASLNHIQTPSGQACRPCCSVSPSAMEAAHPVVHCNGSSSASHLHCRPAHTSGDNSHWLRQTNVTATGAPGHCMSAPSGCDNEKLSSLANNRLNRTLSQITPYRYRSKHHYENYYDDENEDTYHRLTASIGMQFGLAAFDPRHHHHHQLNENPTYMKHTDPFRCQPMAPTATCVNNDHSKPLVSNCECCRSESGSSIILAPVTAARGCETCGARQARISMDTAGSPEQRASTALQLTPTQYAPVGELQRSNLSLGGGHLSGDSGGGYSVSGNHFEPNSDNNIPSYSPLTMASDRETCRNFSCNLCHPSLQTGQIECRTATCNPEHRAIHNTSILVHQPSTATPPPFANATPTPLPLQQRRRQSDESGVTSSEVRPDHAMRLNRTAGNSLASSASTSPNIFLGFHETSGMQSVSSPKHRQLPRDPRLEDSRVLQFMRHHNSIGSPVRRMSVAGDQMHQRNSQLTLSSGKQAVSSIYSASHHHQHLLEHRASIASDGTNLWRSQRLEQNQQNIQQSLGQNSQQAPIGGHRASFGRNPIGASALYGLTGVHSDNSTFMGPYSRPNDSSMFDSGFQSNRSNYSSSAGSSSGLGVSGSQCTNTPTASVFPYGSFVTPMPRSELVYCNDALPFVGLQQSNGRPSRYHQQQLATALSAHMVDPDEAKGAQEFRQANDKIPGVQAFRPEVPQGLVRYEALGRTRPSAMYHGSYMSGLQQQQPFQSRVEKSSMQISGGNRKYSLPVHLESHTNNSIRKRGIPPSATNESHRYSPCPLNDDSLRDTQQNADLSNANQTQAAVLSAVTEARQDSGPSRRSSQTITRQSSFWLEEDSQSGERFVDSSANSVLDLVAPSAQQPDYPGPSRRTTSELADAQEGDNDLQRSNAAPSNQPQASATSGTLTKAADGNSTTRNWPTSSSSLGQPCLGNSACLDKTAEPPRSTNRLSSSSTTTTTSTSSTASSPSPDFSRPSERILALAVKSNSTISKRRMFSKLKSRRSQPSQRQQRAAEAAQRRIGRINKARLIHQNNSEPGPYIRRSPDTGAHLSLERPHSGLSTTISSSAHDEQLKSKNAGQSSEQDEDLFFYRELFLNHPAGRPVASDHNSASMERQCRELWKLRASLHRNASVGDNWSNYHQRLNRRYDSGYKSIENQFSSSVDGSTAAMAASATTAPPSDRTVATRDGEQQATVVESWQAGHAQGGAEAAPANVEGTTHPRPQSGCSGYVRPTGNEQTVDDRRSDDDEVDQIKGAEDNSEGEILLTQPEDGSFDLLNSKLADLELEETPLDWFLNEPLNEERECQSRSSKGSHGNEKST